MIGVLGMVVGIVDCVVGPGVIVSFLDMRAGMGVL